MSAHLSLFGRSRQFLDEIKLVLISGKGIMTVLTVSLINASHGIGRQTRQKTSCKQATIMENGEYSDYQIWVILYWSVIKTDHSGQFQCNSISTAGGFGPHQKLASSLSRRCAAHWYWRSSLRSCRSLSWLSSTTSLIVTYVSSCCINACITFSFSSETHQLVKSATKFRIKLLQ